MIDPYQVLGVSHQASDDEVKKAYRNLSRRYHPDANVNNPNKAQAEEKFKEVQQAYDQIMKEKQQGNYSYGRQESSGSGQSTYGNPFEEYGPFGGFYGKYYRNNSGQNQREESPRMNAAINYINNNCFKEALHVLSDIPVGERKGRWYYYSAMANNGVGNTTVATEHIQMAVNMEPSNLQYRQYQQFLAGGGTWYTNMGNAYERPYASTGRFCMSVMLMQLLCTCCCRGPL